MLLKQTRPQLGLLVLCGTDHQHLPPLPLLSPGQQVFGEFYCHFTAVSPKLYLMQAVGKKAK